MQYFILTNTGPSSKTFSAQQIADLIHAGTLSSDVFVRDERQHDDWISASAAPEISALHVDEPHKTRITGNAPRTQSTLPGTALGRLDYFLGLVMLNAVSFVLSFATCLAMILWGRHFGGRFADPVFVHRAIDVQSNVIQVLILPTSLWLCVMRCRDLGMRGWHCLKMFIPLYNLAFFVKLLAVRGRSSTAI